MEHVLEKVSSALEGICGVPNGAKMVVAVSGGPDSVFLLNTLLQLTTEPHWNLELSVAHLDHGLRGEESRQDQEFAADLCAKWDLPFTTENADLRSLRRPGESLEQAARRVRYRFLEETAAKTQTEWIATGHTADDQAETLLLRIIRGTGIEGLSGIIPARPVLSNSSVTLVRPLLDITRAEIIKYLRNRTIPWRTDSSNADQRFERNRVRACLSALSEKDSFRLRAALCALASCALRDWAKIDQIVSTVLAPSLSETDSGIEINLDSLDLNQKELAPYIAREMIKRATGNLLKITKTHIRQVQQLVFSEPSVGRMDLPGGTTAIREYSTLRIGRFPEQPAETNEIALPVPGRAVLPDGTAVEAEPANGDCLVESRQAADDSTIEYVDREKISVPLMVRYRRTGDRFCPLGIEGKKKLKNFFTDTKVPRSKRDFIPIVTSENEIVWVAGCRLDERFKLDESTRTAVRLSWLP